jgi:hypothetical protein
MTTPCLIMPAAAGLPGTVTCARAHGCQGPCIANIMLTQAAGLLE